MRVPLVIPCPHVDRVAVAELVAGQVRTIGRDGGDRAAVAISAEAGDGEFLATDGARKAAFRGVRIAGRAFAGARAGVQFGRIDADEADALTAAAQRVAVDDYGEAGEEDGEHCLPTAEFGEAFSYKSRNNRQ